jgi:hypothetical protein
MSKYLAELAKNVGNPLGADFFQRLGVLAIFQHKRETGVLHASYRFGLG